MKRLLLVGAGHAHAQVLKDWIAQPLPATELVLVSPHALAPYSGMVPGWLAGSYRYDEICVDFAALAWRAGARFVVGELAALDPGCQQIRLSDGQALSYDVLSLNIGSTLHPPPLQGRARLLALRPLGALRGAWEQLLADPELLSNPEPLTVTAVGGGAAGVEALLAVLARLRALCRRGAVRGALLSRSPVLLAELSPGTRRAARAALDAAGVSVQLGSRSGGVPAEGLLLWATGAEAYAWQATSGLAVDERGFFRIDSLLRSVSHPQVHAVGDCAAWSQPLPKAGVHAVRMGPVLSHNLRAALGHGQLRPHRPQRAILALLATADGQAIASWRGLTAHGRWVWKWKDHIDRGFVRRFSIAPGGISAPTPCTPRPAIETPWAAGQPGAASNEKPVFPSTRTGPP